MLRSVGRPVKLKKSAPMALLVAIAFLLQGQAGFAKVKTEPCKNGYTPEQQIQLGQQAVQQVYKQMPVLPDSSAATKYIRQLGKKLAAVPVGTGYIFYLGNFTFGSRGKGSRHGGKGEGLAVISLVFIKLV